MEEERDWKPRELVNGLTEECWCLRVAQDGALSLNGLLGRGLHVRQKPEGEERRRGHGQQNAAKEASPCFSQWLTASSVYSDTEKTRVTTVCGGGVRACGGAKTWGGIFQLP